VLWVVLPVTLSALPSVDVAIEIVVLIEIVVVVDVHIAVIPIAVAPVVVGPCATHGDGRSPSQCSSRLIPRIGVRIVGSFGRCRSIHYLGVV